MHSFFRSIVALFLLASIAGCGVRTGLESSGSGMDGGPGLDTLPMRDFGPSDGGSCTSDRQCDDNLFCNGTESCVAGHCQHGPPPMCVSSIACVVEQCVEGAGCIG